MQLRLKEENPRQRMKHQISADEEAKLNASTSYNITYPYKSIPKLKESSHSDRIPTSTQTQESTLTIKRDWSTKQHQLCHT
ncbi:hypothetical protein FGO68_gene5273 [Halteria grandinella]|uniref:Uncharacterized protein n=1 Tax=Halteria grandinella TaxID=5974 RepID=A0A8J8T0B2_HALGN|nr:hypothetical protein FGO68_gene5273 [Halteria grandinella]